MRRMRIIKNELRSADVWVPTNVRQRVFVALHKAGRWQDVIDHFEFELYMLPYSQSTKTAISIGFFRSTEPELCKVCEDLSAQPGFIATTTRVYRPAQ